LVEFPFLLIAAAVFIHLLIHFTWRFSASERDWLLRADAVHRRVGHTVCLEQLGPPQLHRMAIRDPEAQICP
jgi:hypothetical protein